MPTFKSGAFAQQCYSSHPLSLTVKTLIAFTPAHPGAAGTAPLPVAPASAPTLPPPRPDAALSRGPTPAETAPLPEGTGAVSLYRLVVSCDNCGMRHRFVIETLTSRLGQEKSIDPKAMSQLSGCVAEHPADLRVSNMDVVNDSVRLMCGDCRRTYDLVVSTMETYQK
jgi:hypothetical protein